MNKVYEKKHKNICMLDDIKGNICVKNEPLQHNDMSGEKSIVL